MNLMNLMHHPACRQRYGTGHGIAAALLLVFGLLMSMVATAAPRVLETAYGQVSIEGTPERVVTLYEGALDAALAAGVQPLAAIAPRGGSDVADYLEQRAGDVAIVRTTRELNLEAIVSQQPDLILASPRRPKQQYELLSRIAPTVVPPGTGLTADGWKAETRLFGKALGRQDQIEAALAEIEQRAAALAEQVQTRYAGDDRLAYLVRWMPQGAIVMSTQLFSTGLLDAAGFDVRDSGLVGDGRPHSDPLSLENLARVDGDWLFLATLNEEG